MIRFGKENNVIAAPFLKKISENDMNKVTFIVSLSCYGKNDHETEIENQQLRNILKDAVPIIPDDDNTYEIVFDDYILYQTRNESYCSSDRYEITKGKYFVIYEKSRLLDMLGQITDCQQLNDGSYYPSEWVHYGICCQNHIVDIISCNEPLIRKSSD